VEAELELNSVITTPRHDQRDTKENNLQIPEANNLKEQPVLVKATQSEK
jgi:predicted metal-dependent TIM-barrel fold hydrolase